MKALQRMRPELCARKAVPRGLVGLGALLLALSVCAALMAPPAWTAGRPPTSDLPLNALAGRPTITSAAPAPAETPAVQTTPAAVEGEGAVPAAEAESRRVPTQEEWPVALLDTFDGGAGDWDVGVVHLDVASLRRTVAEGAYTWELDARQPIVAWSESAFDAAPEVKAALRARLLSGAATDLSFGLAIRPADAADMRLFLLSLSEGATVRHGLGESATSGRDWTPVAAVRPADWNQLALQVAASGVSFRVNGQQAIELPPNAVPPGRLCIVASILNPGRYVLQFDDVEVRVPPSILAAATAVMPSPAATLSPTSTPAPAVWGEILPEVPYTSPPRWPIVFWDEFVDNGNGWVTVEQFNLQIESSKAIDGSFAWQFKALETAYPTVKVPHDAVADFYAAVDARRYSGPAEVWYGLTFRQTDARHYYCFLANDRQKYQVWARSGDMFRQLIEPTRSEAIRASGPNRVGVAGEGQTFTFFVNDQALAALRVELEDISFPEGLVALVLGVEPGDTGIIDFDNFELRVPAAGR